MGCTGAGAAARAVNDAGAMVEAEYGIDAVPCGAAYGIDASAGGWAYGGVAE